MWLVEWAKTLAPVAGLAASCWTLVNTAKILWLARKREKLENEKITIIIRSEEREVILAYKPRRKNLNRAELLGILGMCSKVGRFSLDKLSEIFTSDRFDDVSSGKTSILFIEATEDETYQF